ncbi:hypothetical protein NDU88_006745 [Pleurodeles waltl]|uniref:Uncharacterized protein n=1 Tax=Pleurodeles waltl TaxID=8319 RepID=A0AAV7UNY6_PLEWA|nr:hypothetical protein NDU88_006745 [Pleurodeles waltl]
MVRVHHSTSKRKYDPAKEQATKQRAQVVAEVEQHSASISSFSPTSSEYGEVGHLDDDLALIDTLLLGGPELMPMTADEVL